MLEFLFDTARAYTDLVLSGTLARHPGIRWIATYGGGALPLLADRIELFRTAFGDGSDFCWTPAPAVYAQVASLDVAPPASDGRSRRELTTANAQRLPGTAQ